MNNVYNEPKYDTDMANKGYVDENITKKIAVAMGDVEEDLSELDGKINTKTQNFGSQPTPPYHVNDSWMNGTDIYVCVRERLIGNFVSSDWQKASTYDNTKSILDGGVTTDGTLVVAKGGTVAAGLTAYTSGDNGVRMWAGSDINGINSAPFRVTQKGYLYASNANIQGTITSSSANITGGSIKVHGTTSQTLIKAYVNNYENTTYTEISPTYFRFQDTANNMGCWLGAFGDPTLQISKGTSTNSNSVTVTQNLISVLKQQGSSQTISTIAPDNVSTPKITAGNIDCGTCRLSSASDTTVSFHKTFSSIPMVVLTCKRDNTGTNVYAASVVDTTTTYFKAFVMTNGGSATNILFNWIAIGA